MWSLFLFVLLIKSFGDCARYTYDSYWSYPLVYTTESRSFSGKWCLNDCVNGMCVVDIDTVERCNNDISPALTFYTTGKNYPDEYKCTSRCKILKGDARHRCYVGHDWNKIDYCNPDTTESFQYRDFTLTKGPCANECQHSLEFPEITKGNCYDISGVSRTCLLDKYFYETVKTVSGHKCNGECYPHDGTTYNWCYYSSSSWDYCARPALNNAACFQCDSDVENQFEESVKQYAERMERDPTTKTVKLTDRSNPVHKYTYKETITPKGVVRLPLVLRARVYRYHIQRNNAWGTYSKSAEAKENCKLMGMTRVDGVEHLIPQKLGGNTEFYNFVPMTQLLNLGQMSGSDVYAPSVRAATERQLAHFIQNENGQVNILIVIKYNHTKPFYPYRPTHIGWSHISHAANGDEVIRCPNYWFDNNPNAAYPNCHY